jgi:Flp pilus assembly protein TadB
MDKDKAEALGVTASLAGIGAAGLYAAESEGRASRNRQKQIRKNREERRQKKSAASKARVSAAKTQAAEMAKKRLNDINPKNLSADDKKIRTQLIKEQNDIIKGNKPKTPTSVLKSLGLRALPAVGAFIAMLSPTPAYGQGGKVCRGRPAQSSAEKGS